MIFPPAPDFRTDRPFVAPSSTAQPWIVLRRSCVDRDQGALGRCADHDVDLTENPPHASKSQTLLCHRRWRSCALRPTSLGQCLAYDRGHRFHRPCTSGTMISYPTGPDGPSKAARPDGMPMPRARIRTSRRKSGSRSSSPRGSTRNPPREPVQRTRDRGAVAVLSELTDALDLPTKAKLLGTLAKDLVKVPDHDLWPHLKEWVRPVHRA